MSERKQLTILGAGLTGLSLAYFLRDSDFEITILESRDRAGGRIYTVEDEKGTRLEMGATWFGNKHENFVQLVKELGVEIMEQDMGKRAHYEAISTSPPMLVDLPPSQDPTYKLRYGTAAIIDALLDKIRDYQNIKIELGNKVSSLKHVGDYLEIESADGQRRTANVVSTLPPYLLTKTISITPPLSDQIQTVLNATHTWMGESIKIGLSYEQAFWKEEGQSGTVVSNVGPIPELYDHSDESMEQFGFVGFFNSAYASMSKEQRLEMIMVQLEKYYGKVVRNYRAYEEVVWSDEPATYLGYEQSLLPHFNNGNQVYRESYLKGKLWIAGSETSPVFPGYMEGAVGSAKGVAEKLRAI